MFDKKKVAAETWKALLSAGVFVEGDFTFASGKRATLKADAEQLYSHPKQLQTILGFFATYPCVQEADTLLFVPEGMRKFVTILGHEIDKPVAKTIRKPAAISKYDFIFESQTDQDLALSAEKPVICEDIVSTLGSVAAIRSLLRPEQDVHSLAMLMRGTVNPEYQVGLTDHYLLEREIPTDKDDFRSLRTEST